MRARNLALLLALAALTTGITYYATRPQTTSPASSRSTPGRQAAPAAGGPASGSAQPSTTLLPPQGWGRNPFLTVEEIKKLSEPKPPVETPPPAATVQPPVTDTPSPVAEPLPAHVFSGVLIAGGDAIVFLNGRSMRIGSTIGRETVLEIREDSVILESEGKTRELSRKTNPPSESKGD